MTARRCRRRRRTPRITGAITTANVQQYDHSAGDSASGANYGGADRSPDPAKIRMVILTKITYPTGGSHEFDFEANEYAHSGSGPLMVDGPEQSRTLYSGPYEGLVTTTFTVGGTQTIIATVTVSQDPTGCETQVMLPCPFTEIEGPGVSYHWNTNGTVYVNLPPATYTMRASDEGNGVTRRSA